MITRFYDRERSVGFLKELVNTPGKQMVSMYGRRRIGKTTLLKHVFPNVEYFFVDTRSSNTLLSDFSQRLIGGRFNSWEEFFRYLLAREKIVIFDEFQNFLKVDKSVFSILQKVWDEFNGDTKLILCGSYVGMMKRIFLDSKEPLFGRTSYNLKIEPFDFKSSYKMLSDFGYTFEEGIVWYSILGGVPKYLWYLQEKKPFEEKIYDLFYSPFAPLKEEGKNILIMEFGSEHLGYFSVLKAIGNYDRKLSEIADKSALKDTTVSKYFYELVNYYDVVEKVENKFSGKKRDARYRIKDNYLRFWYRFVYGMMDVVEFNPSAALKYALENISQHVGFTFEHIIMESLGKLYNSALIPCMPVSVGKNWGKMRDGSPYEIDVIGECKDKILLVECKWTSKEITQKDIDKFLEKIAYVKDKRKKIPIIISRSPFKPSTSNDVIKITLKDLERVYK